MTNETSHPALERWLDLIDERLPVAEQVALTEHLAGCPACSDQVGQLRRLVKTMRTDCGDDAPPAVIARAARLLRPVRPPQPEPLWERLQAVLRFDSGRQPLVVGLRAGPTDERHLLFQAADHAVDLRLAAVGGAWQVRGQVLGPVGGGEAALWGADTSLAATIDELGEFCLPAVPAGTYRLVLHLAPLQIEIAELSVPG